MESDNSASDSSEEFYDAEAPRYVSISPGLSYGGANI